MAITTYAHKKAATLDATLRAQVEVAISETAIYVLNGGSPNNRNHETHAESASKNPASYIDAFIWHVVEDTTIKAEYPICTDAHVKTVIDAKWGRVWK